MADVRRAWSTVRRGKRWRGKRDQDYDYDYNYY